MSASITNAQIRKAFNSNVPACIERFIIHWDLSQRDREEEQVPDDEG